MTHEIYIASFAALGFIFLIYSLTVLFRIKEQESNRITPAYNALLFGLLILSLSLLAKAIKYIYLIFSKTSIDSLIYFDVASTLILLPLAAGSFLVSMFIFRRV